MAVERFAASSFEAYECRGARVVLKVTDKLQGKSLVAAPPANTLSRGRSDRWRSIKRGPSSDY